VIENRSNISRQNFSTVILGVVAEPRTYGGNTQIVSKE
jgi:hypothetical protein